MSQQPVQGSEPASKSKRPVQSVEAVGVIILAILVLIITLIRYWGNISWSLR